MNDDFTFERFLDECRPPQPSLKERAAAAHEKKRQEILNSKATKREKSQQAALWLCFDILKMTEVEIQNIEFIQKPEWEHVEFEIDGLRFRVNLIADGSAGLFLLKPSTSYRVYSLEELGKWV